VGIGPGVWRAEEEEVRRGLCLEPEQQALVMTESQGALCLWRWEKEVEG
jgi:hypothetical protein